MVGGQCKLFSKYWMYCLYAANSTYTQALLHVNYRNGQLLPTDHMDCKSIVVPRPNTKEEIKELVKLHKEMIDTS
eukprot:1769061-Ditylum_brightwellii.AAC.1